MKTRTGMGYKEIMNNNDITFDEVDLNFMYEAIHAFIATSDWNVLNADDRARLVAFKALQTKILRALDDV